MTTLNILQYHDIKLKEVAKLVSFEDIKTKQIQDTIKNMFETMYQAKGIGLAAIQVGIPLQIITIDLKEAALQPLCIINPKIMQQQEQVKSAEGCLSFPGIFIDILRFKFIEIEFWDQTAAKRTLQAENLLSFCIQHEIDHLNGINFIQRLSLLKRSRVEKKINKLIKSFSQN